MSKFPICLLKDKMGGGNTTFMIKVVGDRFIDDKGRMVLLRGVNLGGSTKVPWNEPTHVKTDFANHRDVSFINRPFPLDEADEHFSRLKHWGFNTLRFLTTWEAIEHAGPGKYDTAYLDYLDKIVKLAGDYGFYVFMDPHQDVFSRHLGGDGAPGWTLESAGFDVTKLSISDAALTMQYHYPDSYPAMRWAFNYYYLGTATMFTLFFAGREFAPKTEVNGIQIQDYLQSHFINSMVEVAKRLKNYEHVIGYGPINEPGRGYIGIHDITKPLDTIILGRAPTPFQTMVAGSGIPTEVPFYYVRGVFIRKTKDVILNESGISSWKENCIWQKEGVWELDQDTPKVLRPDHFANAKPFTEYLRQFSISYINAIREVDSEAILFLEGEPMNGEGVLWFDEDPRNIVNAGHWYDAATLVTKRFRSWFTLDVEKGKLVIGSRKVRSLFKRQLQAIKENSKVIHGGIPTVIGEFGIPYDMHGKKAYRTGNFNKQQKALSLYYDILDELQLHSTQWNYTPDNTNEFGDQWNLEDLSIFSRDQQNDPSDINSGGRAIRGFCRPYPRFVPGELISYRFNKTFEVQFVADEGCIEAYIPDIQFPAGITVNAKEFSYDNQILKVDVSQIPIQNGRRSLVVRPK